MEITTHHLLNPLRIPSVKQNNPLSGKAFQSYLHETLSGSIKVSKHAEKRMNDRNILLSETTWSKIESKLEEAKQKGVNESLVLTTEAALVISAKNETVITAMKRKEASSQLFTGINGVIIID
ncbi:flagellar protein [Bacillus sp. H-16]|uniref:TIGR02530 family flagellar biosynthesis protein n=1 Tax=Alteribacter salitolerans TaxID=2912333 RepID=UPI0019636952|nr:flagellar protein [Alteribacter salitolerans]